MYPDYERNNYPMSITDEDGPFLVMEATLFGTPNSMVGLGKAPNIDTRARLFLRRLIFASR